MKTYKELTEQVMKSHPVYSFINKPQKVLLSSMEHNSAKLSSSSVSEKHKINILDEQIKILSALIINQKYKLDEN
jgi:hypothetical protein